MCLCLQCESIALLLGVLAACDDNVLELHEIATRETRSYQAHNHALCLEAAAIVYHASTIRTFSLIDELRVGADGEQRGELHLIVAEHLRQLQWSLLLQAANGLEATGTSLSGQQQELVVAGKEAGAALAQQTLHKVAQREPFIDGQLHGVA